MIVPAWSRLVFVGNGDSIILCPFLSQVLSHAGSTGPHMTALSVSTIVADTIDWCVCPRARCLKNLKYYRNKKERSLKKVCVEISSLTYTLSVSLGASSTLCLHRWLFWRLASSIRVLATFYREANSWTSLGWQPCQKLSDRLQMWCVSPDWGNLNMLRTD